MYVAGLTRAVMAEAAECPHPMADSQEHLEAAAEYLGALPVDSSREKHIP